AGVISTTVPIGTVEQVKTDAEVLHQLVQGQIQLHRDHPQLRLAFTELDDNIVRLQKRIDQLHQSTDPFVLSELETELQSLQKRFESMIKNATKIRQALESLKTECEELKRSIEVEINKLLAQNKGNQTNRLKELEQEVILIEKS